jgi:Heterokaryon incompatibility protein (HET)
MEVALTAQDPQPYNAAHVSHIGFGYLQTLCRILQRYLRAWVYIQDDCEICRSYFPDSELEMSGLIRSSPDPRLFEPNQEARCHGCRVVCFFISFLGYLRKKRPIGTPMKVSFSLEHQIHHTYIDAHLEPSASEGQNIRLEIFRTTAADQSLSWLQWLSGFYKFSHRGDLPFFLSYAPQQTIISANTGSQAAFSKVFSWFKACTADHPACGNNLDVPLLPTRVIDIAKKDNLALVESKGCKGHYICLSHRWIDPEYMPRCTQQNIASLKRSIPWTWITPTFQDAITFARHFSHWHASEYPDHDPIHYIWIDSLCIIQDSVEDWDNESKLMCSVYEGAILTVAAATGTGGCFSIADPAYKGFGISKLQHDISRIYVREALPNHDLTSPSIQVLEPRIPASSLDLLNRGWVLQERLLSRRFVLFTPLEVMWECLESSDCECGFKRAPRLSERRHQKGSSQLEFIHAIHAFSESNAMKEPNYPIQPIPLKIAYHRSLNNRSGDRERNIRNWWRRLVEIFSGLNLTKDSDTIPALAGLATQLSRACGKEEPLFGHFLDGLPMDLAWYVSPLVDEGRPPMDSVPSWSWAHCKNPVRMPYEDIDHSLKVCGLIISGPSRQSNSLRIRCSVFTGFSGKLADTSFPLTERYFPDRISHSEIIERDPKYILLVSSGTDCSGLFLHVKPVNTENAQFCRLGVLQITERTGGSSAGKILSPEVLMRTCFISVETMEVNLV